MHHLDFVIWLIGWPWLILNCNYEGKISNGLVIFRLLAMMFWAIIAILIYLR